MKVLFCVFLLSLALFGDSFKFGMQIRIPNKFDPKKLPEYNLMSCCRPNFQDINDWDDIVPDEISDFGYAANDKVFIREMGKKGVLRYQTQYGTWVVEVFHDSHMSDSDFIEMEEDDFYHISNKKFKSHHWDGEKKSPKDNNDLKSMIANLQAEVQALRKGIEFQSRWQERAENLEVELYRSQFYERLILGVLAYHMDRLNDARLCFMLADSMSYRDRVSDAIINEYYNKLGKWCFYFLLLTKALKRIRLNVENKISENSTSTNSLLEGAPVKEYDFLF